MLNSSILRKPLFWLVLITVLLWLMVFSWPDNRLHLIFCNVGQGDAILITYKQTQILIDGGPDNKVLNCLSEHLPFWDRQIEMMVSTHPEGDHFTGLIGVIKRYNVKQFVVNSIVNDTASFWEFYQAMLVEKTPVWSPKAGDKIKIGPIQFLVLWPKEKLEATTYSGEFNKASIVLELTFGNFCALLTGDIPVEIEDQLVKVAPCQVLKVAHHGSKYSTSEEFLEKVRPVLAVISVGQNRFGHPSSETLERLKKLGIKVLRTDDQQNIEIVSDGGEWWLGGTKGLAL